MKTKTVIMDKKEIETTLKRLAMQITEKNKDLKNVCIVGIKSRGVPMAKFISKFIKETENISVETAVLDISFYRDDLSKIDDNPVVNKKKIDFDVNNKAIILVDDVLYTGKTVKTAMDVICKNGTAESIQFCVLIDRGHHKLPIYADYTGKFVPTSKDEIIKVNFKETDNEENVKIMLR